MCILICRVGPDPLLAANRDEVYARPFCAPRRWVAPTPFWAPRDEEEGGTWIGVNVTGLMAAITNRSRLDALPGRPSRGHLVTGLLARNGFHAARAWLEAELRRRPHNPCQLLMAQGAQAYLCRVDGARVETDSLAPGMHVISNLHDPDEIDFGLGGDAGWDRIHPILADARPGLPGGFAVCKRSKWRGTVSSALIEPGRRFLFAGGAPDQTAYEPVSGYPGPR